MDKSTQILIVEDDAPIREMYRIKFTNEGFEVQTAEDGLKALNALDSYHPNVILLDVMMPNMDGMDFLVELRKREKYDDVKVIILTNIGDVKTASAMLKIGASEYVTKADSTPTHVVESVRKILTEQPHRQPDDADTNKE